MSIRTNAFLDLEMTCDGKQENGRFIDDGRFPLSEREIISAGLVIAEENGTVLTKYHSLIRPKLHPVISSYCTSLTGIRQEDLEQAADCRTVFEEIERLCKRHSVYYLYVFGNGDKSAIYRNMRIREINLNQQNNESLLYVYKRIVDIRPQILARLHLRKKGGSLLKIADSLNIDCSQHHTALGDAEILAEICKLIFC